MKHRPNFQLAKVEIIKIQKPIKIICVYVYICTHREFTINKFITAWETCEILLHYLIKQKFIIFCILEISMDYMYVHICVWTNIQFLIVTLQYAGKCYLKLLCADWLNFPHKKKHLNRFSVNFIFYILTNNYEFQQNCHDLTLCSVFIIFLRYLFILFIHISHKSILQLIKKKNNVIYFLFLF